MNGANGYDICCMVGRTFPDRRLSRTEDWNGRQCIDQPLRLDMSAQTKIDITNVSVMSSSAPTSPTSSDGDDLLPTLPAVSSQHRDRRRRRPIPQFSYSKTRTRPGLIAQCGPFFGFNARKTIHRSSYHSDVSQSAPSSPTADTYETLPLVENAVQLDGICSGETPEVHVQRNSTAKRDLPSDLRKLCSTMNIPNNFPAATKPSLLQVLQRLGIQSVWPRLVEHGIIDVRRLGQITRTELIQMGITDAEVRSALLTAGQLLAVQDTDVLVSSSATAQCTWTRTIPPEGATDRLMDYVHMADEQAMHDSGCCSINEVSGSWCNKPPECTVNSSAVQLRSPIYSIQTWSNRGPPQSQIEASARNTPKFQAVDGSKQLPYGPPPMKQSGSSRPGTLDRRHASVLSLVDASGGHSLSRHTSRLISGNAKHRNFHPTAEANGKAGMKTPVGILRNARDTSDTLLFTNTERRSTSAAPKTVKIDESSLMSSRQQPLRSAHPDLRFLYPAAVSHNSSSVDLEVSATNRFNALWQKLHAKLCFEQIDLTAKPYSNEVGEANIPIRLTQRYATELNLDLMSTAMAMEAEREARLREARRPVIPFMDEIRSQRYLNCDGIKTGNAEEFLIGLGLPMYVAPLRQWIRHKDEKSQEPVTAADLVAMSDTQLMTCLGFSADHLQWFRREAVVIPSVLLSQPTTFSSHVHPRLYYHQQYHQHHYHTKTNSTSRTALQPQESKVRGQQCTTNCVVPNSTRRQATQGYEGGGDKI